MTQLIIVITFTTPVHVMAYDERRRRRREMRCGVEEVIQDEERDQKEFGSRRVMLLFLQLFPVVAFNA